MVSLTRKYRIVNVAQNNIIGENKYDEFLKSLLQSFAKYLNLPWHDLELFTQAIKFHEEAFENRLKKGPKTSKGVSLTATEFHFRNFFHIFSCPINQPPRSMKNELKLRLFSETALELLIQSCWSDLKDELGLPMNLQTILVFLTELTIRIANLEHIIEHSMPQGKKGHAYTEKKASKYMVRIPKNYMSFTSMNPEECLTDRFEIYFRHLNPQTVFSTTGFSIFKDEGFFDETSKEVDVGTKSVLPILSFVKELFNSSILPIEHDGSGRKINYWEQFRSNKDISSIHGSFIDSAVKFSLPRDSKPNSLRVTHTSGDASTKEQETTSSGIASPKVSKDLSKLFNQRLITIYGDSDAGVLVETPKIFDQDLKSNKYTLALIELKCESDLGKLAIESFSELQKWNEERGTSRVLNQLEASHVRKRPRVDKAPESKDASNEITRQDRFNRFILEVTCYCKLEGCPLAILSNGDDYVVLFVEKLYEKIENFETSHKDVFGEWRYCVVRKNEHPILTVLTSILLGHFKEFLKHRQLTNMEIVNWYQTFGASYEKKMSDRIKFLLNRRVFHELLGNRVDYPDGTEALFKFSWENDNELFKHSKLGDLSQPLKDLIRATVERISKSHIWKTFVEVRSEPSSLKIETFDSEDFQIIQVLHNKTSGRHVSATIIHASLDHESNGILKVYDTVRMLCYDKWSVSFRNGYTTSQSFEDLLFLAFKMYFTEFVAYESIGNQDFVPKIYHTGAVYISKLIPDETNTVIYENPFLQEGSQQSLKSDAMFIFMEFIEAAELDNVDFEALTAQALEDLEVIHNAGVIHRDISHRNTIIKKSDKTDIGHRVVFLDFGLSFVSNLTKGDDKKSLGLTNEKKDYTDEEVQLMTDEKVYDSEDSEIIIERLRELDRRNLMEAIEYFKSKNTAGTSGS